MSPSTPHRFLLTGANGFIASHILDQLLTNGHNVVATVRSAAKATALHANFASYPSAQLETRVVPDMTLPGAFDAVFSAASASAPIDVVLHTASPFLYKAATGSNAEDFLDPAIKGTEVLLEAAQKAGTVKRVVMTSSCAAVIDYKREAKVEKEGGRGRRAYRASKKFSELAAWKSVGGLNESGDGAKGGGGAERESGFDLVVLCPPAVFGPIKGAVDRIAELGESNSRFWKLFVDSSREKEIANKMPLHVFVDVRDLARAHILAAIVPSAGNKRFLVCAGSFSNRNVVSALRREVPELAERTLMKAGSGLGKTDYGYSSERAREVMGLKYRDMRETFVELARQLLEIEAREKGM